MFPPLLYLILLFGLLLRADYLRHHQGGQCSAFTLRPAAPRGLSAHAVTNAGNTENGDEDEITPF